MTNTKDIINFKREITNNLKYMKRLKHLTGDTKAEIKFFDLQNSAMQKGGEYISIVYKRLKQYNNIVNNTVKPLDITTKREIIVLPEEKDNSLWESSFRHYEESRKNTVRFL